MTGGRHPGARLWSRRLAPASCLTGGRRSKKGIYWRTGWRESVHLGRKAPRGSPGWSAKDHRGRVGKMVAVIIPLMALAKAVIARNTPILPVRLAPKQPDPSKHPIQVGVPPQIPVLPVLPLPLAPDTSSLASRASSTTRSTRRVADIPTRTRGRFFRAQAFRKSRYVGPTTLPAGRMTSRTRPGGYPTFNVPFQT